jgi:hypothetical protein
LAVGLCKFGSAVKKVVGDGFLDDLGNALATASATVDPDER